MNYWKWDKLDETSRRGLLKCRNYNWRTGNELLFIESIENYAKSAKKTNCHQHKHDHEKNLRIF